ncbi:unnamed protein product [Boreogadus saida]
MDGLTARLTGKDKLLVLALMSGTSGARRALCVFEKQQRYDLKLSLSTFLEMLCQNAISPGNLSEPILPRPLVCLFPVAFKRNVLSFLRLVNKVLPQTRVVQLLECLSKDPRQDHWVTALIGQLQRDMGSLRDVPLYTASCSQRLKMISERLKDTGRNEGWANLLHRNKTEFSKWTGRFRKAEEKEEQLYDP